MTATATPIWHTSFVSWIIGSVRAMQHVAIAVPENVRSADIEAHQLIIGRRAVFKANNVTR